MILGPAGAYGIPMRRFYGEGARLDPETIMGHLQLDAQAVEEHLKELEAAGAAAKALRQDSVDINGPTGDDAPLPYTPGTSHITLLAESGLFDEYWTEIEGTNPFARGPMREFDGAGLMREWSKAFDELVRLQYVWADEGKAVGVPGVGIGHYIEKRMDEYLAANPFLNRVYSVWSGGGTLNGKFLASSRVNLPRSSEAAKLEELLDRYCDEFGEMYDARRAARREAREDADLERVRQRAAEVAEAVQVRREEVQIEDRYAAAARQYSTVLNMLKVLDESGVGPPTPGKGK